MALYRLFLSDVDNMTARLSAFYARHLVCRVGCSSCCQQDLTLFEVEAAAIHEAIQALGPEICAKVKQQAVDVQKREQRGESPACPLLIEDRCAIYKSRPLICRTQGLPLLFTAEDGQREVDFCPLNFTAHHATDDLDEEHLVPLELLNEDLVKANFRYCRELDLPSASAGTRFSISQIILNPPE